MSRVHRDRRNRRNGRRFAVTAVLSAIALVAATPPAQAAPGVAEFDGQVTANAAGDSYTQAGGHPYEMRTTVVFDQTVNPDLGIPLPDGDPRTVRVDLPPGLIANPQGLPLCQPKDFFAGGVGETRCPIQAQVGVAVVGIPGYDFHSAVYNLVSPTDEIPVALGFEVGGQRVILEATVGPAPDYAVSVTTRNTIQGTPILDAEIRVWGTPADPAHDVWRCQAGILSDGCTGGAPETHNGPHSVARLVEERPFAALPTSCTPPGVGVEASVRANFWQTPNVWDSASFMSHLPPGYPLPRDQWGAEQGPTDCDRLAFEPSASVQPSTTRPDAPTGLNVSLAFDQGSGLDDPSVPIAAALRGATVTLPEGMSINPAAANGLAACTDDQLGRFDTEPSRCPDASKVGTVSGTTPILDDPLTGDIYVASQNSSDPESGEMFRMFLVMRAPGLVVKLVGQVRANASTGRLEATFDNNPQYPVSDILVKLAGGAHAPLATPASCGEQTTRIDLTSWAGHERSLTDSFTIPCPGAAGFEPSFDAGTVWPAGGSFSPLLASIERRDGERFLSGVKIDMPRGLIARLAGVDLCPDALAAEGTPGACPAGSRIGKVTVGAGAGSPFHLPGDVYLTGPYRGAPYGLSVQVPAKAGPFDLGVVKVRQRIDVDPETAAISVTSDPLPQIVGGVPTRARTIDVDVDRPGFTINPTSCDEKRLAAALTAIDGQVRTPAARFRAAGCRALAFTPRMAMHLTGKRQRRTGGHPGLTTVLTQAKGQANIAGVEVTLPGSIALDPYNTEDRALLCGYDESLAGNCPRSSTIGRAVAHTPVLDEPLSGPVHLVQGIKFGPKGNRIRTTPGLLIKLRGDVAINVRARTNATGGRLVTTVPNVPDAPVSRFSLSVKGGKKGILTVTRTARSKIDLCAGRRTARVAADGHNGRATDFRVRVKTPCAKGAKGKGAAAKRS